MRSTGRYFFVVGGKRQSERVTQAPAYRMRSIIMGVRLYGLIDADEGEAVAEREYYR